MSTPSTTPSRLVLVVPADSHRPVASTRVVASYETWCRLVGDVSSDTVFCTEAPVSVQVSAFAKSDLVRFPHNQRATQLTELFLPGFARADFLAGDAVFVGFDDEGDYVDVPADVMQVASNLFGVIPSIGF